MKRVAVIISMLAMACCSLRAQYNVLSLGGRVGGNGYFIKTTDENLETRFGVQTMFDLSYTYLGNVDSYYAYLGFKLGGSVGWNSNSFVSQYQNQFINYDYLGKEMDYTIKTDNVIQKVNQYQAEASAMLAFRYTGVCVNVGIKGMFPFKATYKQSLNGIWIAAYYPEYDVTVTNELITGRAAEEAFSISDRMNVPQVNLLASVEFGYEFELDRGGVHALGVMAYLDYCFWNNYSGQQGTTEAMITVDPISNSSYPVPAVHVGVISQSSISAMNYFDAGIKLYYRFQAESGEYGGRGGHRYKHGRF